MHFHQFDVFPQIPEKLEPLREIAMNLWYSWNWEAIRLFARLDQDVWEASGLSPTNMLAAVPQERLEEAAQDESFVYSMNKVSDELNDYMNADSWFCKAHPECKDRTIAYFSAEYGLDIGLPIYAGGLGMLSGDHLKSSSDLGIPLVAVGLMYDQGYFRQYLNADGWQQESMTNNDFAIMPVKQIKTDDGKPVQVSVDIANDKVLINVWKAQVGRIPLYLLNTNVEGNLPHHRTITQQLYGGDKTTRMRQEIVLGIGGVRALEALDIKPDAYHMNEGHSAFLALERIARLIEKDKLTFRQASEVVWGSNVFTTHTPVPAGIDTFTPDILWRHFSDYIKKINISWDEFLAMGRPRGASSSEPFSMAILAINLAAHCNGVSELHGKVARRMWTNVFPGIDENDVPIGSITNGIHTRSWLSRDVAELLERYIGDSFKADPLDKDKWLRVDKIPDGELWSTHERRRERLIAVARGRIRRQLERRSAPRYELETAAEVLDPNALTIGFARRFATYKRATLLARDLDRLEKLLNNPEKPVQFIFAGKAHPQDIPGKELIRTIVKLTQDVRFRGRIIFLEDYDMVIGRYLVRGCDIWLNTPRRPREASGTSGMKAAANGALNVSILDGWWCEGYSPELGWSIGAGEEYDNRELQDQIESLALYELLEQEIVPRFFDRGRDNLPRKWIKMMKESMKTLAPQFSTHRMVYDYSEQYYLPASNKYHELIDNDFHEARELAEWRKKVRKGWGDVKVLSVTRTSPDDITVGADLEVEAVINLDGISPDDISVTICVGPLDPRDRLLERTEITMEIAEDKSGGVYKYTGKVAARSSGRHGFAIRILPKNRMLVHPYDPGLIAYG